jgi:hypothetical protein
VLEDRWDAGQMLRGADDEGESRRRNYLALDVAAPARRTGVIRALAVTGAFLVAAGMGLPSGAPAQTPAQGQAVGLLFLLGAARTSAQASAKTPGQKPKPGTQASHESAGRIADAKQKPLPAKDGTVLVRTGGGPAVSISDKAARTSDPLDGTVLRVTSDQKNGRRLDRPGEPTDRTDGKHN